MIERKIAVAWLLSGCATVVGLHSRSVERVCLAGECYLRAPVDVVNARCSRNKKTWDDGSAYIPGERGPIRACTILKRKRHQIWIAYGNEKSIPHERAHIKQWERDGFVFIPEHHRHLAGVGWGLK